MSFHHLQEIEPRNPLPGCTARFVHSQSMTLSYWNLEKNAVIPHHSHPHEQVTNVIEGELELTVAGQTQRLTPGSIAVIPSHAFHSANALSPSFVIDVFYPVREDYR